MRFFFSCLFLLNCFHVLAQESDSYSVYLVGDAGEDTIPGKALLMLKQQLTSNANSAVVFLGDNLYPSGLHLNDKASALHLESQLQILKAYAGKVYFIPGNHDWDAQSRNGLKILKNEEVYVEEYLKKTSISNKENATFLPENGLPGPESVMLNNDLRLIIIDTQWFLHLYKKNYIESKKHTEILFFNQLDSLLAVSKNNHEQVIIAAHHPLYSNGQHAKSRQPFRVLVNYTPFQLFGLLGVNRLYSQDLSQPRYKKMRKKMLGVINKYDNITYVSGHDHNLQCFKKNGARYIVSGSGSKRSKLLKNNKFDSVFQDDKKTGFIKIEFKKSEYNSTTIYRVGESDFILEGY